MVFQERKNIKLKNLNLKDVKLENLNPEDVKLENVNPQVVKLKNVNPQDEDRKYKILYSFLEYKITLLGY